MTDDCDAINSKFSLRAMAKPVAVIESYWKSWGQTKTHKQITHSTIMVFSTTCTLHSLIYSAQGYFGHQESSWGRWGAHTTIFYFAKYVTGDQNDEPEGMPFKQNTRRKDRKWDWEWRILFIYIYILFFKGKQSSIGQESGNISLNKGNTDSSKISCAWF